MPLLMALLLITPPTINLKIKVIKFSRDYPPSLAALSLPVSLAHAHDKPFLLSFSFLSFSSGQRPCTTQTHSLG